MKLLIMSKTPILPRLQEKFECKHCLKVFSSKQYMLYHVRKNHDPKPCHCDKCDEKFEFTRDLINHHKKHHAPILERLKVLR